MVLPTISICATETVEISTILGMSTTATRRSSRIRQANERKNIAMKAERSSNRSKRGRAGVKKRSTTRNGQNRSKRPRKEGPKTWLLEKFHVVWLSKSAPTLFSTFHKYTLGFLNRPRGRVSATSVVTFGCALHVEL